jgi:phage major head subunit gpT-like protein
MIVNKAAVDALFFTLAATFNKAFEAAPSFWSQVAMRVPSSSGESRYPWFDYFPKMRPWVGDKAAKQLRAFSYTVVNEAFEATVEVSKHDIADDNLGIYAPMAEGAGHSAKQWPDELIGDMVNGAFTTECFDGQYFVDTDHPVVGSDGVTSTVSNKETAALSAATQAAAIASYGAARTKMLSFKDSEGRPLNCRPTVLVVGPALETTARVLMMNERLEDGKPNPFKGDAQVLMVPWITSTTAWFVLDTSKPVKPFIFQEREAPVFVQQINTDSDNVFNRGVYRFGAEARGNGGYGFWQLCVGSTGAG